MNRLKQLLELLSAHQNTVSLIIGLVLWHQDKELARYFIT